MASIGLGDEPNCQSLSDLFDEGMKLYGDLCTTLEPSNTTAYQEKVKKGIQVFEKATMMVNELNIFAKNETVEEVSTADLKFFLLPVILGDLNLKLNGKDRLLLVEIGDVYYRDFLVRCKDYGISDVEIPAPEAAAQPEPRRPGPVGLMEMAKEREEKIRKLKEKKEMEAKLAELKVALENPSTDDDTRRQYYLGLVKQFLFSALDELKTLAMEKPILEHMAKMKDDKKPEHSHKAHAKKPLKPIIITRDALQKRIYGLGYPSIPGMTVEELVNQRMKEGWYDNMGGQAGQPVPLRQQGLEGENPMNPKEREEVDKEENVERDDAETLGRTRAFDDWKDDHRRGWGNRHNMG